MNNFDKNKLKEYIKNEHPIIFDVGCYDGNDSLDFLNVFQNPTIYSFEADKRSVELFKNNVHSDNIKLVESAVSDIDGEVEWYGSDSDTRRHYELQDYWSASSSMKKPKKHLDVWSDVYFKEKEYVKSITLDSWVSRNNIGMVDFIWCDVNGANREFIKGATNTLADKVRYMMMEFEEVELYDGSLTLNELLKLLPSFEKIGVYNFAGNFGNVLLKNKIIV